MSRRAVGGAPKSVSSASESASDSEANSESAVSDTASDPRPAPGIAETRRVLVVTGLAHKNERHYGPLADAAGETTLVSLAPVEGVDAARNVTVPQVGPRLLRIALLFVLALYEGYRNDYDAVASISLFPYGCYALALKAVYGYPAHLGIIGIDLDHHAAQRYGPLVRWLFRRFDVVSVPGSDHADRLARCGVPPARIERLTNPIDADAYRPPADRATGGSVSDAETDADADADTDERNETTGETVDFVWVGRFSTEKDPHRFVAAAAELDATGREFSAVMVGDGPLYESVAAEIQARGLADRIELAGWVDDPLAYYHRSETFVLTSKRDALPLVLLEAMATELASVVPRVGSIQDAVTDGENGLVVADREPETYAAAMARCLDDPELRTSLAANATAVRDEFSMARASADWRRILAALETD
ncbi:glycosyltransferase [Natrialba asiatica]|uniref:Group 1 glycosyl transferase n=1 Tax=Natrialba asiatica (strain ATCC 700177 / DSM 12278 / JCM 9576 / FERM P-10747 / NBRC 102637 / 172P1) TaxID=29540 RepID=M0AQL0_NATA1|nr:glycosyltransferase [Natrialba asiatica]ELZ00835.1 group 1 glycosyl transferase [Natrialba asiatica DSM 12278]